MASTDLEQPGHTVPTNQAPILPQAINQKSNSSEVTPAQQVKKKRKLTLKQRKWLLEYLKDGNGTKAAIRAYNPKTQKSAAVISSENLRHPQIVSEMEKAYERIGLTKEKFGEIIGNKVLKDDAPAKDHTRYCQLYVDTAPGVKAPSKTESEHNYNLNINTEKVRAILSMCRNAPEALQDTITINPHKDIPQGNIVEYSSNGEVLEASTQMSGNDIIIKDGKKYKLIDEI